MRYRPLGTTGIDVSVLAIGCWPFSGDSVWGNQDDADSIAAIHAALDQGINLFDTAEVYGSGRSEEVVGQALEGRRHQAIIATKVSRANLRAEDVFAACEGSLRRLRTDYIDLYQIHWPNWDVPLDETWGALQQLKEQGKVRAISVCNFGVRDLDDLLKLVDETGLRCQANQLPYSLLWRTIEFGIQAICEANRIGMLCYSPLMQGLLTGKYRTLEDVPAGRRHTRLFSGNRPAASRHDEPGHETLLFATIDRIAAICDQIGQPMNHVALAWLLAQPAVTSLLVGVRNLDQVRDNVDALQLQLSPDVVQALSDATDPLKQALDTNPDMYQSQGRSR